MLSVLTECGFLGFVLMLVVSLLIQSDAVAGFPSLPGRILAAAHDGKGRGVFAPSRSAHYHVAGAGASRGNTR